MSESWTRTCVLMYCFVVLTLMLLPAHRIRLYNFCMLSGYCLQYVLVNKSTVYYGIQELNIKMQRYVEISLSRQSIALVPQTTVYSKQPSIRAQQNWQTQTADHI